MNFELKQIWIQILALDLSFLIHNMGALAVEVDERL